MAKTFISYIKYNGPLYKINDNIVIIMIINIKYIFGILSLYLKKIKFLMHIVMFITQSLLAFNNKYCIASKLLDTI